MNIIELEIKYLLKKEDIKKIKKTIESFNKISKIGRFYEKTIMFDNDSKIMDSENARLRVRELNNFEKNNKVCIEFSYKRRIQAIGGIKKEEEIELSFKENPNTLYDILKKMRFNPTTSYERYRETYKINKDNTKITIDEFPFGYILEIEGSEKNIKYYNDKLGLDINNSYPLSCDDAYVELCKRDKLVPKDHILFNDAEMPKI